jgi:CDP-diacylglycerol--serine O-phosphatidyltransferase
MSEYIQPKAKNRGIYLLPNLFTIGALFAGFYACVIAMHAHYFDAGMAIIVAMILDGLDGRIARLTHTQTVFGAELDSLSDMVSFGIAPALVAYAWALQKMGAFGWVAAFAYAVAVALRLARFNTQLGKTGKRFSQGLACTPAAGVIAGMVAMGAKYHLHSVLVHYLAAILLLLLGVLMVSKIRYRSFKDINFKESVSFLTVTNVVLVLILIALNPAVVLFALFFLYAMTDPIVNLWQKRRRRKQKRLAEERRKNRNRS